MVNDINLGCYSGTQFNIIGPNETTPFRGVFDGNGHAIHNFSYYTSEGPDPEGIGLFGYVNDANAEIKNLELVGPYLRAQASGTLVGYLVQGTLTSCSVKEGDIQGFYCGMLVCDNGGTIRKCFAAGSMLGSGGGGLVLENLGIIEDCAANVSGQGWAEVGGFVAYNHGTIRRSFSEGETAGFRYVGGFAAWNYGAITDCYSIAYVRSTGISAKYLGGFVAENHGTIENCYSTGKVVGGRPKGGFIANNPSGTVLNCFWDVNTSGTATSDGGTGLTTSEMQTLSTFTDAGWDFVGEGVSRTWRMCVDGVSYPLLQWQSIAGDFICPDGVNFIDYSFFSEVWLDDTCGVGNDFCGGRDLDESGIIDEEDLKILCSYWLDGI